jgi:hypothetical protein
MQGWKGAEAAMPDAHRGIEGLDEELAREREAVEGRSSPYARALELLPGVLAGRHGRFLAAAWADRRFFAWYERPLLLLAAIRNDVLAEGEAHPLWPAFGPGADPAAVLADDLADALEGGRDRVYDALGRRTVQTNETSRAIAWLWPAALAGASGGARPIAIADVGASAGLNLVADALPAPWTDEDGAPIEVARGVHAVARVGLDPAPLDALAEEDARWLRACVWPGEREREARLLAALDAFRAARTRPDAPVLVPIAAANVPSRLDLLSAADRGALVIATQTVVRDYVDPAERAEYERGMRSWLAAHPPAETLWVELEAVDVGAREAALTAHVRAPDGRLRAIELGRTGMHPVRIRRAPGADAELRALLAREGAAARA